jgi:FemAB-related protein (PEP-CTERM system-associated)
MLRSSAGTVRSKNLKGFSLPDGKTDIQNADVRIKAYCEDDRGIWDRFVLDNVNSSFFHLSDWKDVVEQNFRHKSHYIMAFQEEKLTGILPLTEVKSRLFGHALVSVPFGVYGGICSLNSKTEPALLNSAATLGKLMGVDYVELRNENLPSFTGNSSTVLPEWKTKDLYVTFKKELLPDVEDNFQAIPRKQRRMIRQGIKSGLTSEIGYQEHLKDFYNIYARSVRDLGTPVFPFKYFVNLMDFFPRTFILSIWKGNKMVAGVMTFIFKDRLMPYYGGALKNYYQYAVNDFMYWELMKYGCENKFRVFDFGRSKKGTGAYEFKRHWGFEPEALPYSYSLINRKEMPNVSPANPKYSAVINIWKKMPLFLTNWLGPKLVRSIP